MNSHVNDRTRHSSCLSYEEIDSRRIHMEFIYNSGYLVSQPRVVHSIKCAASNATTMQHRRCERTRLLNATNHNYYSRAQLVCHVVNEVGRDGSGQPSWSSKPRFNNVAPPIPATVTAPLKDCIRDNTNYRNQCLKRNIKKYQEIALSYETTEKHEVTDSDASRCPEGLASVWKQKIGGHGEIRHGFPEARMESQAQSSWQPHFFQKLYSYTPDAYFKMSDIFSGITTCQVARYQPFAEHTLHAYVRNTSMENGGKRCQLNTPRDNERPLDRAERFSQFYRCVHTSSVHPHFKRCHLVLLPNKFFAIPFVNSISEKFKPVANVVDCKLAYTIPNKKLDIESFYRKRLISEMVHIKKQTQGINRQNDTKSLLDTYTNMI
ncbi:hypothetical protein ALC57_02869 [Trachymyrmex cornetzi]|uniref:Uncharacterized protein n=1 Tax=Trachymyrmex cornetzi TaxID=471704 RepID=A0A195EHS5_9HYME|nr:hypothetical protein ALC57_02869 [Trachymyrmex cornetzi]